MQLFLPTDKRGKERERDEIFVGIRMIEMYRCGKSFTMQGLNTPGSPQRGVIPRSFEVRITSMHLTILVLFSSISSRHHRLQPVLNISFVRRIWKSTMKVFVICLVKMSKQH